MSYHVAAKKSPSGRCVARYDYRGRDKMFVATKLRFENKGFEWGVMRDALWIPGEPEGVLLPMYHADELAAADSGVELWIAEGEKDADALRERGLLATSCPHGALADGKRWEPHYYPDVARFARVAVLEDNDDAGRQHVAEVAGALHPLGIDVRVVTFRDLPDKADASDFLARGGSVADLVEMANAAPRWEPPEWPPPVPLTEARDLPDFPTDALPSWLGTFSGAIAVEIQAPPAVSGLICLTTLAATVARKVTVHIRDNWTEPLNLYTAVALGPANLKSPAFRMALAPLETWERVEAARLKAEIADGVNKKKNLEARLAGARRNLAKAEDETTRTECERETKRLTAELEALRVPRAPQLIANDVTEEALGRLLQENDGRIAVMSDEGGPIKNLGRYSANGSPVFDAYKHGHNAGTVRVNRIGRDALHVPLAAITLGLMMQPDLLRRLKDSPELRGEGLLARFLYAVPQSLVGERDMRSNGVPLHVAEAYRERIKTLLDLPFGSDEVGANAPHVMELSHAALDRLVAFMEETEPRLGAGGDLHHVADWAGKLRGQAARLAALLHLAELAGRPEPWLIPVTDASMAASLRIVREFLIPHGVAAFAMIGGGRASDLAEIVLAFVRSRGLTRFTTRNLHRARGAAVNRVEDWRDPLDLLAERHYIRSVEIKRSPKGGRPPSDAWDVNPAVLEGGSADA